MGKSSSLYLENLGKRKERISGFGIPHRWNNMPQREPCFGHHKTKYRILGLVGVHYFRTIDLADVPEMTDEEFNRWLEWALAKGSNALTLVGTHDKAGRTNKRLNARYR